MTATRWLLGSTMVVLMGGFLLLNAVAGGFRRSFGASDMNPLVTLIPFFAGAVLLAGIVFPANRILLHTGAVIAVGLIGGCVWQIVRESGKIGYFGILYLGVWLVFYTYAAWPRWLGAQGNPSANGTAIQNKVSR